MKPRLLLTFANRPVGQPGHLRALPAERRAVEAALADAVEYGLCDLHVEMGVTRERLSDLLQDAARVEHVVVFHYAGHASGSALSLEGDDTRNAAHAGGLAAMLGRLPRLQLVFLNGCSTEPQVRRLLDAGVPAVISTAQDVDDRVAKDFAAHFYKRLASRDGISIEAAFRDAADRVRLAHADPAVARAAIRSSFAPRLRLASPPRSSFAPRLGGPTRRVVPWRRAPRPPAVALDWRLDEAADDPLFTLPRINPALPPAPFKGPLPYGSADTAAFFGRRHTIRALWDALHAEPPRPVILHGPIAAGRTSVLHAGLAPRLAGARVESPADLDLASSPPWRLVDDAHALSDAQLAALTADPARRCVLATTPDGLTRLVAACTDPIRVPLDHLDAAAWRRIMQHVGDRYGVRFDAGLIERIATAVASGGAASVIGSVVLTLLHERAAGDRITAADLDDLRSEGLLDPWLSERLGALRPAWLHSGFALDALAHHMTLLGTTRSHAADALAERYAHRDDVAAFTAAACAERLLVRTRDGTRLGHDLLAPLIASRFATSRAPGQQARRILAEHVGAGTLLNAELVERVEAGRPGMPTPSADAEALIARSAATNARNRWLWRGLIAAAVILLGVGLLFWRRSVVARAEATQAQIKEQLAEERRALAERRRVVAEAERTLATRTQAMATGLVDAYRALDDPDPGRQFSGLLALDGLVEQYADIAPPVARLALQSWGAALQDAAQAWDRVARPNVIVNSEARLLVDAAGRLHPLAARPTRWFALPGGRFVALVDEAQARLALIDAASGAARAEVPLTGDIAHVGHLRGTPAQSPVIAVFTVSRDKRALEPEQLIAIDSATGRTDEIRMPVLWNGCAVISGRRAGTRVDRRVRLAFGPDGLLSPAPGPIEKDVPPEDCVRDIIELHAPAPHVLADIAPAWRRWRVVALPEGGRDGPVGAVVETLPAAVAAHAPARDGADDPDPGCEDRCDLLANRPDPRTALRVFGTGPEPVFAALSACALDSHPRPVLRACTASGAVATAGYVDGLTDTYGLKPLQRDGHLLWANQIIRLRDPAVVDLRSAGVARDLAATPDGAHLALLTDAALILFERAADGRYLRRWSRPTAAANGAAVAAAFATADRLIVQRARDVLAVEVASGAVSWRRAEHWHRTDRHNAGVAANDRVVAVRRGSKVRLLASADGTPLSPVEGVAGLSPFYAARLTLGTDGSLSVQDEKTRFERAGFLTADQARLGRTQALDTLLRMRAPSLPALSEATGSGPRCSAGRALRDGMCWAAADAQPARAALIPIACHEGPPTGSMGALLDTLVDHLVEHCVPGPRSATNGCGILYGLGADAFGDSPDPARARAGQIHLLRQLARTLLTRRFARRFIVREAAAWIARCRPDATHALGRALDQLELGLRLYREQGAAYADCEKLCEPLDRADWAMSAGLDPDQRHTDACFRGCRGRLHGDALRLTGVLRFIHRRTLQGISVDELEALLGLVRSHVNWD